MLSVSPTRRQGTTIPAGDTLFLSPVYAGQRGEARPPRGAAYCIIMLQKIPYDNIHISTPASAARCDRRAALWRCIIIYCI